MPKQASMQDRVADALASMMQAELDDICPEESMSRYLNLGSKDGTIMKVRHEDGLFIVSVDVSGKVHELRMKPVGWSRLTPAEKPRTNA